MFSLFSISFLSPLFKQNTSTTYQSLFICFCSLCGYVVFLNVLYSTCCAYYLVLCTLYFIPSFFFRCYSCFHLAFVIVIFLIKYIFFTTFCLYSKLHNRVLFESHCPVPTWNLLEATYLEGYIAGICLVDR